MALNNYRSDTLPYNNHRWRSVTTGQTRFPKTITDGAQ